ncbi:MAG: LL-diaminopimelate aminotransferase [Oligoflexales bacterium]|nr:LL-diaminopimelate aminotransferase [Oligoflexales bacterium]
MIKVNENYLKLKTSYLFSEVERKVSQFRKENEGIEIIKLGIGDVTKPLPAACIEAFLHAVKEMGSEQTFRGYGPYEGYEFLREKIVKYDFRSRGVSVENDEIFVSDGSKCDTGNFQELFSNDIRIGIPDPVYPVYVDTNVMAGRTGSFNDGRYDNITYLECSRDNGFVCMPPKEKLDLIYLCFPNNPTGAAVSKESLKAWVDYARRNKALILYDAAYVAFIRDAEILHSIFEIDGAREVAVEFRSFSKTAGFTGVRCAYTVIPKECMAYDGQGKGHSLHGLWSRRFSTKFNGVSYPVQRAAEAVYSEQGQRQVKELTDYYMGNASLIKTKLTGMGYYCTGGDHSPYIWVEAGRKSWDFFDLLLKKAAVVCTPGEGFGRCGEGYIRISSFNSRENVEKALERFSNLS